MKQKSTIGFLLCSQHRYLLLLAAFLGSSSFLWAQCAGVCAIGEIAESFSAMGTTIQTSTVPDGINSVVITAKGADGGNSVSRNGGAGARTVGTFTVIPGQLLQIHVGVAGTSSTMFFGGGGGGGSSVRIGSDNANILVVAGGGGGAGFNNIDNAKGKGGQSTSNGGTAESGSSSAGGVGGTNGNGGGSGERNFSGGGGGGIATGGAGVGGGSGFGASGGGGSAAGGAGVGGGGGGDSGGGGGGGYSGGGGGAGIGANGSTGGGGGGSFVGANAVSSTIEAGMDGSGSGSNGFVCLCYSSVVVPVELVFFHAQATPQGNLLTWQTATEQDNRGFEVQRSKDGRQWQILDFAKGHGTTLEVQTYKWLDGNPLLGINYYRLKQLDFDGAFEYSPIVQVVNKSENLHIFPNPVQEVVYYQMADTKNIERVQLFDMMGKLVKETTDINGRLPVDDLLTGVYLFIVETKNERLQHRIIKQ